MKYITYNIEHRTKNKKYKTKNLFYVLCFMFYKRGGFSLIELLVVITLVGIIGVIISQVFITSVRVQGRSEVVKEVKQNGDFALSVIESMVRNARDIPLAKCNTSADQLTIENQDGFTTTFDCANGSNIASVSSYTDPTPTISTPLTNNKVTISNCSFMIVCPTPPLYPKYVYVNFSVSQTGSSLTPTPGSYSTLDYQTTVSLRNYK